MAWQEDLSQLKAGGFSDADIAAEGQRQRDELTKGGFSSKEVDDYFGVKEPDLTPIKDMFKANLDMKAEDYKRLQAEGKDIPKKADSILEAFEAGFGESSWAMMEKAIKGKSVKPDTILPEDADSFYRIASQTGSLAGDLPAMVAGGVAGSLAGAGIGGAAGSVVPVAGNVAGAAAGATIGAGAGSFALPQAIRSTLMNFYEKGEIHDFKDFWERMSATLIDTTKQAAIGAATAGTGGLVLRGAGAVMAPAAARMTSIGSEIATMVTMGKAFEGQTPKAQDFLDAALLVGGMHVAGTTAGKLREIYSQTGTPPHEVVQEAQSNPVVKQQLLDNSKEIPDAYKAQAESSMETGSMKINGMDNGAKSEAPAEPSVASEPQTAQDKILSKIQDKGEKVSKKYGFDNFYRDFVDKLDPINRAVKELADGGKVPTDQNAYELSRMASDAPAKALHFLGDSKNPDQGGILDFKTLETTGPSLQKVLEPVKEDLKGFDAYLVSKRALELEDRGIKSGMDLEAAKQVVDEGTSKYENAANGLVDFQNGALKYLRDSGMISKDAYSNMVEAGKSYIPFKRILGDGETTGGTKGAPVKRIKGSDLAIQSPLQSVVENLDLYLKTAETNRAKTALVDQALKTPEQTVIEKVPGKLKPITVSESEIMKALSAQGVDASAEAFTIFRKADQQLASDEFAVYRNGKREVYKTSEPMLAEAIKTLDGNAPAQNMVFKIMNGITGIKRLGITLAPDFIIRNLFRDTVTAGVFSQSGKYNLMDVFGAMGSIIKKDTDYYNWLKSGGANGAFLEVNEHYLEKNVFDLDREVGFIDKAWNVVKTPIEMAKVAGELLEQSTRLAEAKRVMGDATSGPDIFKAGMASREVTVDFQRIGAKMSAYNAITAFQNAQIQGLDRTIRAIKEDPSGTVMKAAMMITAPSLLLWYANKDDERYKEIPQWEKDLFWILPTDSWQKESVPGEHGSLPPHLVRQASDGSYEINKGVIYRFPKPQELGVLFGSLPERMMDAFFTDHPDSFKNFGETMGGIIAPTFVPDALSPVIEQAFNQSMFTKNKLVPGHLEQVLPQYQYVDYTSQTARALGKMIAPVPFIGDAGPKNTPLSSPMILENYVRSWSGNMGMYALQIADKGLQAAGLAPDPVKPAWSVGEIPIVKAFTVRYPSQQAESIRTFYESMEDNKRVLNTIKDLSKQGDFNEATLVMQQNQSKLQNLEGVSEALKNQASMIRMIYKNPNMKPDEKRQLIDGLYYGMIQSARAGNDMNKQFKTALEQQKKEN
jgi:hypothetical protein